jgi:hypothetical protein
MQRRNVSINFQLSDEQLRYDLLQSAVETASAAGTHLLFISTFSILFTLFLAIVLFLTARSARGSPNPGCYTPDRLGDERI